MGQNVRYLFCQNQEYLAKITVECVESISDQNWDTDTFDLGYVISDLGLMKGMLSILFFF